MPLLWVGLLVSAMLGESAVAHNVSASNADFLASIDGPAVPLFIYLGAKHMITGVDHLLYLLALVFLLYSPRQVLWLVSCFALGHSLSLIGGVLLEVQVNPSVVDAVIGLSIVYKAVENLGGVRTLVGVRTGTPVDTGRGVTIAVLCFGLAHGLGLATKLQAVYSGGDGLLINLIAFNIGVEIGQLLALAGLLLVLFSWRRSPSFARWSYACNGLLMLCGFGFAVYHGFDGVLTSAVLEETASMSNE